MPFLFVHLPERFRAENDQIAQTMNENVWRLSCQFDVYETLVDILKMDYGKVSFSAFTRNDTNSVGIRSLFFIGSRGGVRYIPFAEAR